MKKKVNENLNNYTKNIINDEKNDMHDMHEKMKSKRTIEASLTIDRL